MADQNSVAQFISNRQSMLGLTNQEVADLVGYPNGNVMSMIKKGRTKLPIERVPATAEALAVDKGKLMRMVMREYMPATLDAIEECLGKTVTQNELALLEIWRDATDNQDPEIPESAIQGLHAGFQTMMSNA